VFNATFNNISGISWRSVLLVEETGVPGENHRPSASHWQTLSHNIVSSTPRLSRIRTHNVSDIGTDCIGSCKSNYHRSRPRRPRERQRPNNSFKFSWESIILDFQRRMVRNRHIKNKCNILEYSCNKEYITVFDHRPAGVMNFFSNTSR